MRLAVLLAVAACSSDHGSLAHDRLCDNLGLVRGQIVDRLALVKLGHVPQVVDAELPPGPDASARRIQLVQRSLQQCREIVAQWQWVDGALFGFKTAAAAEPELSDPLPMAIDAPETCEIVCSATDCDDWPKAFDERIVAPLREVADRIDRGFAAALAKCKR